MPSFVSVVELAHDAAIGVASWPDFLAQASQSLRSPCALIATRNAEEGAFTVDAHYGMSEALISAYEQGLYRLSPFIARGSMGAREGLILSNDDLMSEDELLRSAYYDRLLKPLGMFHVLVAFVRTETRALTALAFLRPREVGPFTPEERDWLQQLAPHLTHALDIEQMVGRSVREGVALADALEEVACGVLLVDAEYRVLYANRMARGILERADGLVTSADGLRGASSADTKSLRETITRIVRMPREDSVSVAIPLPRPGRRPLVAVVAASHHARALAGHDRRTAIVYVSDPERGSNVTKEMLARLFGFTATEVRVAACLLRGLSLGETADELEISINTVRTHLQHLFRKSGTQREGQLIALLTSAVGHLSLRGSNELT